MADYSRDSGYSVGDRYLDHAGYSGYASAGNVQEKTTTSRVQKKVTKTTEFDFGRGPYTVEDFKEFYESIKDMPGAAIVTVVYHDDQRDGRFLKLTVKS